MANHTTGAQRRNTRYDKIWEAAAPTLKNMHRAELGAAALAGFIKAQKPTEYQNEPLETQLTDCLADLFHFAHKNDIEPAQVVRIATDHFNTEQGYYDSSKERI
jgi:hypothetical protein